MTNTANRNALAAILLLLGLICASPGAHADVTVEGLQIVSRTRVARTTFEFVARVRVRNTGPTVSSARLSATSGSVTTQVIEGAVALGPLPTGVSTSVDTITFRQDRLRPTALTWNVLTTTPLTLAGVARSGTPPFVGATVEATVSRDLSGSAAADWGRPNVETFSGGQTDANGRFSVPVVILSPWDFVTIKVTGSGGAVLGGIVGHAADLIAANGGRASTTTFAQTSRLVVSPFSTSAWALGLQALVDGLQTAGNRITSEAQWQSLLMISDAPAILGRAVYVKVLLENPSLPKPVGYTDTFTLATRDSIADGFRKLLQANAPALFAAGLQDLLGSVGVPYAAGSVPPTLHLWSGDPKHGLGSFINPGRFVLNPDGTGMRQNLRGSMPLAWQLDAQGRLAISFSDTGVPGLANVPDGYPCTSIAGQVEVNYFEEASTFTRMHSAGDTALLVNEANRYRYEYPECPAFPPTYTTNLPNERSAGVAAATLPNAAFPLPIAGLSLGGYFYLTGFGQYSSVAGLGDPSLDIAADILDFNGNGTGRLRRTGMAFSWQLTPDRELDVLFANGDSMRVRHLASTAGSLSVWLTSVVSGRTQLLATALTPLDDSLITVGPDGTTFRNGIGEESTVFAAASDFSQVQIDFSARRDGTGCRRFPADNGTVTFNPAFWYLRNGRFDFDYGSSLQNGRHYQPLRYIPPRSLNDQSTGGWVALENLRFSGQTYDPSTVPGRITFWRVLGSASPCQ